ncbi:hypothetical protein BDB00DRAFT_394569 [Zychaea mexicana]|uniref:uncharacterized protein n=1 Tax=Zychaea mexicana TaxID=64656 RepID=UPI0022FEEA3B|nr:uncharacterized protein BDB00DRAFT_394569 [Zychaea mexicana]KAI9498639.1 hypothetical protein BDB00DRAFT_394569 [Zychaea mexicana]
MWSNASNRGDSSQSRSDNNNSYVFEQQNDVRMNELGSKLSALKNITIDMHQDVNDQDRLVDESNSAFGGLGQTLRQSYGRMNRMASTRHKRQLCYYVAVAVILFFVIYWGSGILGRISWSTPEEQMDQGQKVGEVEQDI